MEPVYIFVLVIDFIDFTKNGDFAAKMTIFSWVVEHFWLENEYIFSKMSTLKSEMTKRLK